MPAEFGLSRPTLLKGTGQLNILYRSFATEKYCWLGQGKHKTRRGHELKSGTAYYVETPEGIKQLGPTCAARVGKQKLHAVADFTLEGISRQQDDEPGEIHSGRLITPPAAFDAKKYEETERAKDIAYLMLRGEIIPGIKARERLWRKLRPLQSDTIDRPLIRLLQEFKKDNTIALGEVRRIREYSEHVDPKNTHVRLLRLNQAHAQIEVCLKGSITNGEAFQLHQWDQILAETRALDAGRLAHLNGITGRVAPYMPHSKVDGLPEILMQASMFEGVENGNTQGKKLHVIVPRPRVALPVQQGRLFG